MRINRLIKHLCQRLHGLSFPYQNVNIPRKNLGILYVLINSVSSAARPDSGIVELVVKVNIISPHMN